MLTLVVTKFPASFAMFGVVTLNSSTPGVPSGSHSSSQTFRYMPADEYHLEFG